jgi:protein-tyrosine-phosphatase
VHGQHLPQPHGRALRPHRLQQLGLPLRVASAGFLLPGLPASPQARQTLAEKGLSAENHRSTQLSAEVLRSAWRIYTMEERTATIWWPWRPTPAQNLHVGRGCRNARDVADPYMQRLPAIEKLSPCSRKELTPLPAA